jgi:antitoxin component YwqK of YwqJK toxin-antitoxin module
MKTFFGASLALVLWFTCASGPETDTIKDGPMEVEVTIPAVSKITSTYEDGLLIQTETLEYGEWGNLLLRTITNSQGELVKEFKGIEYSDNQGAVEEYDAAGKLLSKTVMEFKPTGQVISEELYNADDELMSRSEYSYNEDGQVLSWVVLNGDGVQQAQTNYIYENGLLMKKETADSSGKVVDVFEITRDEASRITSEKRKDMTAGGKTLSSTVYVYEGGQLIREEMRDQNNQIRTQIEFTWDDEGNMTQEIISDRRGIVLQIKNYEYTTVKAVELVY